MKKVRCKLAKYSDRHLTEGQVYEVEELSTHTLLIKGCPLWWLRSRFEEVVEDTPAVETPPPSVEEKVVASVPTSVEPLFDFDTYNGFTKKRRTHS